MNRRHLIILIGASLLFPSHTYGKEKQTQANGNFTSGVTSGQVFIRQSNSEWIIEFGDDFVHEGSPDPWIAFGKDGYQRHGLVTELKQFKGSQSHIVNPRLDPTEFNEIYIWCEKHNTSLGRAKLTWHK